MTAQIVNLAQYRQAKTLEPAPAGFQFFWRQSKKNNVWTEIWDDEQGEAIHVVIFHQKSPRGWRVRTQRDGCNGKYQPKLWPALKDAMFWVEEHWDTF